MQKTTTTEKVFSLIFEANFIDGFLLGPEKETTLFFCKRWEEKRLEHGNTQIVNSNNVILSIYLLIEGT